MDGDYILYCCSLDTLLYWTFNFGEAEIRTYSPTVVTVIVPLSKK